MPEKYKIHKFVGKKRRNSEQMEKSTNVLIPNIISYVYTIFYIPIIF